MNARFGPESLRIIHAQYNLAVTLNRLDKFEISETKSREVLECDEKEYARDYQRNSNIASNLAGRLGCSTAGSSSQ